MRNVTLRATVIIIAILLTTKVANSEELLPLRAGKYLPEGIDCPKELDGPVSKSLLYFPKDKDSRIDIIGETDTMLECHIHKIIKRGNKYQINGQWYGMVGGRPLGVCNETFTIINQNSFSRRNDEDQQKKTSKKETIYNYCEGSK